MLNSDGSDLCGVGDEFVFVFDMATNAPVFTTMAQIAQVINLPSAYPFFTGYNSTWYAGNTMWSLKVTSVNTEVPQPAISIPGLSVLINDALGIRRANKLSYVLDGSYSGISGACGKFLFLVDCQSSIERQSKLYPLDGIMFRHSRFTQGAAAGCKPSQSADLWRRQLLHFSLRHLSQHVTERIHQSSSGRLAHMLCSVW